MYTDAENIVGLGVKYISMGCVTAVLLVGRGCWRSDSCTDPGSDRWAGIHDAAGAGDVEAVERYLKDGVDIDVLDNRGEAPLHHAVKYGREEVVAQLISRGADVNMSTTQGDVTPLHYAVWAQNWQIVELLLRNGAQGEKGDSSGESPKEYAAKQGISADYERAAHRAGSTSGGMVSGGSR